MSRAPPTRLFQLAARVAVVTGMTFMLARHVLAAVAAFHLLMPWRVGTGLRRGRRLSGGERRSHQNQHDLLLKNEVRDSNSGDLWRRCRRVRMKPVKRFGREREARASDHHGRVVGTRHRRRKGSRARHRAFGNSGFSLMSRRLLRAMSGGHPGHRLMCGARIHRRHAEGHHEHAQQKHELDDRRSHVFNIGLRTGLIQRLQASLSRSLR